MDTYCENDNDTHSELENEDFGFMDGTSDGEMRKAVIMSIRWQ